MIAESGANGEDAGGAAFPCDPEMPQLRLAVDPEVMGDVFRRELRPLSDSPLIIRDCRLTRIRHRPGQRCVLQFTLRLEDPATGLERSQWVSGVLYADARRAERAFQRLRATAPGREIPEPFRTFEPVAFAADVGMLVQVFPFDRRMPTLPRLVGGPPPAAEPQFAAAFGPGDWRIASWSVEPVRYRAAVGAVLRYTVRAREMATGAPGERRFYAKIYQEDEGEETYRLLQALWRAAERGAAGGRAGSAGFAVPRPLAYLDAARVLVLEEVPGISLQQVLVQGDPQGRPLAEIMRQVADALATLHRGDVRVARRHRLADEMAVVRKAAHLASWGTPELRHRMENLVAAISAGLVEAPPTTIHGDLKTDHIFLDGGRLTLIDLDYCVAADAVIDAASFLAQIAIAPLQSAGAIGPDRMRTASEAFAEAYFRGVPGEWRGRLPFHYAGACLKEAAGFLRRQEPHWRETIGALVAEAERSLVGPHGARPTSW